jgi:hypothetical protein
MPAMYAATMPGTWSAVYIARICVAPVAITVAGSTLEAVVRRVVISLLTKDACAAERKKVPPTF